MNPINVPLHDGDTFVIDHSSIEGFCSCPRLSEYTIARRLRSSAERVPLKFGGIMHKVLETRYRAGTPMYEQTDEVTMAMCATAETEFSKWSPPEDDYRNYDRMLDFIERYGNTYRFEQFEIQTVGGQPAIEVPFALPLGVLTYPDGRKIKVLWTGRLDMLYKMGGNYLMDHKSASIATNMAEFEISHQFYGYVWAAEQLLGEPVTGFCINRVVFRKPSRTGEAFTFERKYVPISRGLLTDWQNDMLFIVSDFLEMCRRGHLPKHTNWCVSKFGLCPFHKVCTLDTPEQREVMLSSGEYEQNTWTPLK